MEPIRALHRLAAAQAQQVARRQALALGIAPSTFHDHMRHLGWAPSPAGLWGPKTAERDHAEQARGVQLALGGRALVTGASALGIEGIARRPPEAIELLLPANRYLRPRHGACLHYASAYDLVASRTLRGVQVVRVARALADYSAHASRDQLIWAMSDALRLRACTLEQLRAELAARQRFPGRATFRQALGLLTGEVSHSGSERLGRRLLRAAGLRPHHQPLPIRHRGHTIAEVDIPFTDVRYAVEVDGPHHLLPEVAAKDRRRDRELGRLDWAIDRFWWHEIEEQPSRFVQEVTERLAQRRQTR